MRIFLLFRIVDLVGKLLLLDLYFDFVIFGEFVV